jgi:hypothetical protein
MMMLCGLREGRTDASEVVERHERHGGREVGVSIWAALLE